MTPHDVFAAWLVHRGVSDVAPYYPVNIPVARRDELLFGNIPIVGMKKAKKWAISNGLDNFATKAEEIHNLWCSPIHRGLMMIGIMRKHEDIPVLMQTYGGWSISGNDIEFYKKLFFNINKWTGSNFLDYAARLEEFSSKAPDYNVFTGILNNEPDEILFQMLGIFIKPSKHQEILERMMLRGFAEFDKSHGKEAREWGKFTKEMIMAAQSPSVNTIKTDMKAEILKDLERFDPILNHTLPEGEEFELL